MLQAFIKNGSEGVCDHNHKKWKNYLSVSYGYAMTELVCSFVLFLVKLEAFTKTGSEGACCRVFVQLQAVVETVPSKTLGLYNK